MKHQGSKFHDEGHLFSGVLPEEDDANDIDHLDVYDGGSPDEEETPTPAEPVVAWRPPPVATCEAGLYPWPRRWNRERP